MKPEGEKQTRRNLIDKQLDKAGWDPADHTKVIQEVDTKKSDFKARDYRTRDETLREEGERAYADYTRTVKLKVIGIEDYRRAQAVL